jgi:hypothetical protein
MKKETEIKQPVFIAIIAVVVIVACFVGYRVLFPPKPTVSSSVKAAYMKRQSQGQTVYNRSMGTVPPGQ